MNWNLQLLLSSSAGPIKRHYDLQVCSQCDFFFVHILFKKIHLNKVACKLIVAASFVALSGKIQLFKKIAWSCLFQAGHFRLIAHLPFLIPPQWFAISALLTFNLLRSVSREPTRHVGRKRTWRAKWSADALRVPLVDCLSCLSATCTVVFNDARLCTMTAGACKCARNTHKQTSRASRWGKGLLLHIALTFIASCFSRAVHPPFQSKCLWF